MNGTFNRGKIWDGVSSSQGTIDYDGEIKTIPEWALTLETNTHTLRARLLLAERGEISWEECMSNKAGRHKFVIARRRAKLKKESEKRRIELIKKNERKEIVKAHLKSSMNKFLY